MASVSGTVALGVIGSGFIALRPSKHLQVITLHQGTRGQGAGFREESCLHVQAALGQRGVAAGRRTHLLGLWGVCLLIMSYETKRMTFI